MPNHKTPDIHQGCDYNNEESCVMPGYIQYISHFAILLVIGGLFCIGWFQSTRGETVKAPDGTMRDTWAMIFYPLNKWLCEIKTKRIFYSGVELNTLLDEIVKKNPTFSHSVNMIDKKGNRLYCDKGDYDAWKLMIPQIESTHQVFGEIDATGEIFFWKDYQDHAFSPYIYKPIVGCYKCYASFWGTIIYVLGTALAIRTGFLTFDIVILVPMWVVYCMSLVTVNCFIEKKVR